MDCESDMAEGDMRRNLIFPTRNHPLPSGLKEDRIGLYREGLGERQRKKGAETNESVQSK